MKDDEIKEMKSDEIIARLQRNRAMIEYCKFLTSMTKEFNAMEQEEEKENDCIDEDKPDTFGSYTCEMTGDDLTEEQKRIDKLESSVNELRTIQGISTAFIIMLFGMVITLLTLFPK